MYQSILNPLVYATESKTENNALNTTNHLEMKTPIILLKEEI
jgi:hypothetical protein